MAISLKQLAQELGLDYSTVSYALSGKGSVSEATRQRVREAADRMGYVPNGLVRRMQGKSAHSIGVVLPDSILLYNELIQQLYRATAERGYDLRIALTEFQVGAEERAVRSLIEDRVDGIIIRSRYGEWAEVPAEAALRQAAVQKLAVVTYGPTLSGAPFPALELPVGDRTRMAAQHLLGMGHTRLACLLPTAMPIFGPHTSAIDGMNAALADAGIDPESLSVLALDAEQELAEETNRENYGNYLNEILPKPALVRGRELLKQALALNPQPTGLVCYNSVIAIGVLHEAAEQGLRIPEDLALVSVSRGLVADLAPISLTSCDVPARDAAGAVLQLLLDTMAGQANSTERRTLTPVLHVGNSTTHETTSGVRAAQTRV